MKNKINVGIIGFGLSGRYFFSPYIQSSPYYKLCSVLTSQVDLLKKEYPKANAIASVDELLADETIDLVIVASPNPTHFEYARKILLAGKHVIVEKPFTNNSADAQVLIETAQKMNKVLAPFHNRRWDTDFLTVKTLLGFHRLGEVLEFESHFDRYRPLRDRVEWKNIPAPGSGVLYDLGPHLIDQALVLFGKPKAIYADLRIQREVGKVVDHFEIHLHYSGMKAILRAGVFVKELGPRMMVHGRNGSYVKYGLDPQEDRLRKGMKPKRSMGEDPEEQWGILNIEENGVAIREQVPSVPGNYMAYFDNVYRAIAGEEELIVQPWQAKQVIEVIEAAYLSNDEKKVIQF
ncbi:MAG: oxidoreductase [Prolixibacteraceae bacterium]